MSTGQNNDSNLDCAMIDQLLDQLSTVSNDLKSLSHQFYSLKEFVDGYNIFN